MEINITKEPSHKDSAIFLTKLNANKATQQHQEIFNSSDYWHRIRVSDTTEQMNNFYGRCVILGNKHL